MCKGGEGGCRCHLLRPAIENDSHEKFKIFFQKTHNQEYYLFLMNAYRLQEKTDYKFTISLRHIQVQFLDGKKYMLNLSSKEKKSFTDQFHAFLNGGSKENIDQAVSKLVTSMEKLTYTNLSTQVGFSHYLNQYDENKCNHPNEEENNALSTVGQFPMF